MIHIFFIVVYLITIWVVLQGIKILVWGSPFYTKAQEEIVLQQLKPQGAYPYIIIGSEHIISIRSGYITHKSIKGLLFKYAVNLWCGCGEGKFQKIIIRGSRLAKEIDLVYESLNKKK